MAEAFGGNHPFSNEDLSAMEDSTPFLTRARIIKALEDTFLHLRRRLCDHVSPANYLAPEGVDWEEGKMSRGEYLDGVPYLFLDLPRHFTAESSFTYRALFWWGHGVSFSLILGGNYLADYRRRLMENLEILEALQVHVSTSPNPWDWRRGLGHTVCLSEGKKGDLLRLFREQNYLKCSRYLEFSDPEFRENRVDEAGLYAFRALEPLILA